MPGKEELMRRLEAEAASCHAWSNGPGDHYPAHRHDYEKVLYCVSGSVTFRLEDDARDLQLEPGDRIVLPPGTLHSAAVGPEGVTCIEGRR